MDSQGNRVRTLPAGSGAGAWDASSAQKSGETEAKPPAPASPEKEPRTKTRPPLDPTSHASSRHIAISTITKRVPLPKPVLASECLRDEIAPIDPNPRETRWAQGAFAIALLVLGATRAFGLLGARSLVEGAVVASAGAVALGGVGIPSYATRGAVALAAALSVIGFATMGGLAAYGASSPVLFAMRCLAPVLLASALFLRATYRTERTPRLGIVLGLVLFLGAATIAGGVPLWSHGATWVQWACAGSMLLVSMLSLLGFMSAETTGGCASWAVLAILSGSVALAADVLGPHRLDPRAIGGASILTIAIAAAAVAAYQLGARAVGPNARSIGPVRPAIASEPPPEEE